MAIPSVMQGLIETEDGKVFKLDSPKGAAWLESIGSFRYEPSGDSKPYTVRKESGIYWYGCRKVAGKVRKKYIGKTSEISTAKLEEIAEALEIPPVPRANKVAEVAEEVAQSVLVTERVAEVRLEILESQMAMVLQAVEALQEALPGKSEAGDSEELPKVDYEVAERLQTELGNLKTENEALRTELQSLRAEHNTPHHKFYAEIEALKERNRLLNIKSREERQKLEEELKGLKYRDESQSRRLAEKQARLHELETQLETERADREKVEAKLTDREKEIEELRSELTQKSPTAGKSLPEPAEALDRLRAKRGKKAKADLGDVMTLWEILEES